MKETCEKSSELDERLDRILFQSKMKGNVLKKKNKKKTLLFSLVHGLKMADFFPSK